jgi:hypothetical protein
VNDGQSLNLEAKQNFLPGVVVTGRINIGTNQQTTLRQLAHPSSYGLFFGLKLGEKIFVKINVVIFVNNTIVDVNGL